MNFICLVWGGGGLRWRAATMQPASSLRLQGSAWRPVLPAQRGTIVWFVAVLRGARVPSTCLCGLCAFSPVLLLAGKWHPGQNH